MKHDRTVRIQVTRFGYLATLLMHSRPNASWDEIDAALNRIVYAGETLDQAERDAMADANRKEFPEPQFPLEQRARAAGA